MEKLRSLQKRMYILFDLIIGNKEKIRELRPSGMVDLADLESWGEGVKFPQYPETLGQMRYRKVSKTD